MKTFKGSFIEFNKLCGYCKIYNASGILLKEGYFKYDKIKETLEHKSGKKLFYKMITDKESSNSEYINFY